jgi:hypothetical protein
VFAFNDSWCSRSRTGRIAVGKLRNLELVILLHTRLVALPFLGIEIAIQRGCKLRAVGVLWVLVFNVPLGFSCLAVNG